MCSSLAVPQKSAGGQVASKEGPVENFVGIIAGFFHYSSGEVFGKSQNKWHRVQECEACGAVWSLRSGVSTFHSGLVHRRAANSMIAEVPLHEDIDVLRRSRDRSGSAANLSTVHSRTFCNSAGTSGNTLGPPALRLIQRPCHGIPSAGLRHPIDAGGIAREVYCSGSTLSPALRIAFRGLTVCMRSQQ